MSIGAARDGSRTPCAAVEVQVRSSVFSAYVRSAHAEKIEITRKKKRVDSCGMLEIYTAPENNIVTGACLERARPLWRYIGAARCNWNDMLPVCFSLCRHPMNTLLS